MIMCGEESQDNDKPLGRNSEGLVFGMTGMPSVCGESTKKAPKAIREMQKSSATAYASRCCFVI